ncbi:PqqD family peptide modification chaperone [Streptomyces sp. NPDC059578]|uniref:PqqD family peptide modification chaperone n=1 Tax=unclassified Streptomyces TaxID=2593676 RepID=UPI00365667CF
MSLTLAARVTRTHVEGGNAVLLDRGNGRYFQLNPTGATLLTLLLEHDRATAVDLLTRRHPRAAARIADDVDAFVALLVARRLVTA